MTASAPQAPTQGLRPARVKQQEVSQRKGGEWKRSAAGMLLASALHLLDLILDAYVAQVGTHSKCKHVQALGSQDSWLPGCAMASL